MVFDNSKKMYNGYTTIEPYNEDFENYYKNVGAVEDGEWEELYKTLKDPLPVTFRIVRSNVCALGLRDYLVANYINNLSNLFVDGKKVPEPERLQWYPDGLAWIIHDSRKNLKKNDAYKELRKLLIREANVGHIVNQEVVSMIPPLFLDIRSDHFVLDTCASPGSKSSQLIEMLHLSSEQGIPDGVVVANEIHSIRCGVLIHQLKKLNSPCLLVTNNDARLYPSIHDSVGNVIEFDRILCDVPCSGDGTLRKNSLLWKKWNYKTGNGLHKLQSCILDRSLMLLKQGGKLVYSTCSFNPVENEAVVLSILRKYNGTVELIDTSGLYPDIKRREGLVEWKVTTDNKHFYACYDEVPHEQRSTFIKEYFSDVKLAKKYHLERCMRFYPHFQNTGGFFIAVMTKKRGLLEEEKGRGLELVSNHIFLDETCREVSEIKSIVPLDSNFPYDQLTYNLKEGGSVRDNTKENLSNIYIVSKHSKTILASYKKNLNIMFYGTKIFPRCIPNHQRTYRIRFQILNSISQYIKNDCIREVDDDDLKLLLETNPFNFIDRQKEISEGMHNYITEHAKFGCNIIKYRNSTIGSKYILFPMWKGQSNVNLLVSEEEKQSFMNIWGL